MKKLAAVLAGMLFAAMAEAQLPNAATFTAGAIWVNTSLVVTQFTKNIIITNTPIDADQLDVNGTLINFGSTTTSASLIQTNAKWPTVVTNIYAAINLLAPATITATILSTNSVRLTGRVDTTFTAAASNDWGQITAGPTNATSPVASLIYLYRDAWLELQNESTNYIYYTIGSSNGLSANTSLSLAPKGTVGSVRTYSNVKGPFYFRATNVNSNKITYIKGSN